MFGLTSFKCSRTLDSETTWGGINKSEGRKTFRGLSDIPVKLQHTTLQQPFPVSVTQPFPVSETPLCSLFKKHIRKDTAMYIYRVYTQNPDFLSERLTNHF